MSPLNSQVTNLTVIVYRVCAATGVEIHYILNLFKSPDLLCEISVQELLFYANLTDT